MLPRPMMAATWQRRGSEDQQQGCAIRRVSFHSPFVLRRVVAVRTGSNRRGLQRKFLVLHPDAEHHDRRG